jgi:hypothetical protein
MNNTLIVLFVLFAIFIVAVITAVIVVHVRNRTNDNTEAIVSGTISPSSSYTSKIFDIIDYEYVVLQVSANQSSEDTIDIQVSSNNKDWINSGVTLSPINFNGKSGYYMGDSLLSNYFRIKFTNNNVGNISLDIFVTKKNF